MASASPDELERLMADTAEIQERLEAADYYNLDTKNRGSRGGPWTARYWP